MELTVLKIKKGGDKMETKKVSRQWTIPENELFVDIMTKYRKDIRGKEDEEVKEITQKYAEVLYKENRILESRTIQAILEHLAYFDDLLAGIGTADNYAQKDTFIGENKINGKNYFGKLPRDFNINERNPARIFRAKM